MRLILSAIIIVICLTTYAQPPAPVFKGAITASRNSLHAHLMNNTIRKNLSLELNAETEDRWEDAFYALELIYYRDSFVDSRISHAVKDLPNRTSSFQRSLLELLYTNYHDSYIQEIDTLLENTDNVKIFAMAGEYLLRAKKTGSEINALFEATEKKVKQFNPPITEQFLYNFNTFNNELTVPSVHTLLEKNYLPGNVLMLTFQRKNRDHQGLVIVRDSSGSFVKDTTGKLFSVPQLARSINNLPGYLTNGNTPEGIFRMDGFDVSKGSMIGPTTNIQLTMPWEYMASHFYKDSLLTDSVWDLSKYKMLLPENLKNYYPMQQSFFAGMAGRTEIIVHGTTVDPYYYKGMPWFPLTPTMGCLTSKEIWSNTTGRRLQSDQQLLVDAISKAGGPHGYAIVINIDDSERPVTLEDIIPFLQKANQF